MRNLNNLILFASGITELREFESLLCLLIDVALVSNEPAALNVPAIYGIILKNQRNLSFVLKRKVIQLLGKFVAFQDEAILDFHVRFLKYIQFLKSIKIFSL